MSGFRSKGFVLRMLCLTALALASERPARGGPELPSPRAQLPVSSVRIALVRDAHTPELEQLLDEWFSSAGVQTLVVRERSVSLAELTDPTSRDTLRIWLLLVDQNNARFYFAGPASERFFVRDVSLQGGLDEVGRETIAQILLSSATAFLGHHVETPLSTISRQLEARPVSSQPQPASTVPPRQRQPAPGGPRRRQPAAPRAPPEEALEAPPKGEWRGGISYQAVYSGMGRLEHRASLSLYGLTDYQHLCIGLVAAGHYQFPYTAAGEHVDIEITAQGIRLGGLVGTSCQEKSVWFFELGMGVDWVRFRPIPGQASVVPSEGDKQARPLVAGTFSHAWLFEHFAVNAGLGADLQLLRTHYDVVEGGVQQRELTPWQVQPRAQLTLTWR